MLGVTLSVIVNPELIELILAIPEGLPIAAVISSSLSAFGVAVPGWDVDADPPAAGAPLCTSSTTGIAPLASHVSTAIDGVINIVLPSTEKVWLMPTVGFEQYQRRI